MALEHHSEAIEAVFAHIPGLKVVMPSKPSETEGLLLMALKELDPVIFLEPLGTYYNKYYNGQHVYNATEEVNEKYYEKLTIGKAKLVKE
jgi:pyruvate dehydrogenase E1 component beta subunit